MEGDKPPKSEESSFWKSAMLINPYFYGLLLLGLFSIHFYHFISLERSWTLSPIYFLTYALSQSFFEVLVLIVVANFIRRFLHKSFYYLFISLCFTCFLLHYIDFLLIRFMDISIFYGFHWVFGESLDNFIELLHLTGIRIGTWLFLLGVTLFFIPLFAIILYGLTSKLAQKKPVRLSQGQLVKVLCCIPIGLIALDLTLSPKIDHDDYHFYERALPWKSTLISQGEKIINLQKPLANLPNEKDSLKVVYSSHLKVEKRPNIYLFIVESLREDFMTEQSCINIDRFRTENIRFKKTFSSANATQISWYSIFHSNYPLFWAKAKKSWKSGSLPLHALKKMGYKLHVYSAAQLKYYGLTEVMFGKNHDLADSYHVYPHYYPTEAWESDQKAIDTFIGDLDERWSKEGNVFVFFLESTHFNYSWPTDYPVHFKPISEEKTHLRVSNSLKNIELIKNRYRNSIHYMDSLFGKVIDRLKDKNLYDESVIIFTGDHGEEFFEEGQLFHASHLSTMQTQPPIYMKLGDNACVKDLDTESMITSHIDIFPTVLDYLAGQQPYDQLFHGESIFKEGRFPYVMTGRFNGPRTPDEFFIHDGKRKFTLKFSSSTELQVRQLQDANDRLVDLGEIDPKAFCQPVLDKVFR